MKKVLMIFILILVGSSIVGCSTKDSNNEKVESNITQNIIEYKKISASDAKKRLDSEKGIILLDVRTIEEYEEKHIPNSKLIPVEVIDEEAKLELRDKSATIFVYCRSGRRSAIAADSLIKQGYTNVFDLGGIIEWPYETEVGMQK